MHVTSHAQDMSNKASNEYRSRQRERERRRRQQEEQLAIRQTPGADRARQEAFLSGKARRAAATDCGWCGGPIIPRASGPIPKWCSATCRHRAWEQARAAASGRSAVRILERIVTVPVPTPRTTAVPRQLAWVNQLRELATQLDQGAVYDRHLGAIAAALDDVTREVRRRMRSSSASPSPRPWK